MVDSSLLSRSYKPRDVGKRSWNKVSTGRRKAEVEARQTKYFPCKECVEGFNTKRELDAHMTDKHIFVCGECLRIFKIKAGEGHTHEDRPQGRVNRDETGEVTG